MDRNDLTRIGRLGLIMLLAGTPTLSHALGLGKLKVKSTLDEPLEAEIDLSAVQAGEFEAIQIKLATRKEFDEAAIDRPDWLTQLQFEPSRRADGRPYIKVHTADSVNEPYVQFLVSVQWPGGKVVREYTALLNPPVYAETSGVTVSTPQIVSEPTPAATSTPPAIADSVVNSSGSDGIKIINDGGVGDYSVNAGDTLWSIASSVDVPEGVSLYQVMLSILRENPDAFLNNNMNRLKSNQVMRLPGLQDIQAVSNEVARQEYVAQLETWEAYRRAVSTAPTTRAREGGDDKASQEAQLTAQPSGQADGKAGNASQAGQTPPATPIDIIRIVQAKAGESANGEDKTGTEGVMREKVGALEEELAARQAENRDLQDQVGDLQSQIDKFRRLIEIRNNELAQLQQNLTQEQNERVQVETALTDLETRNLADQMGVDDLLTGTDAPDAADATDDPVTSVISEVENLAGSDSLTDSATDIVGAGNDLLADAKTAVGDKTEQTIDVMNAGTDSVKDSATALLGGAKDATKDATNAVTDAKDTLLGGSKSAPETANQPATKKTPTKKAPNIPPPRPQANLPWYETAMNKVTGFFADSDTKVVGLIAAGIAALVALFVWFRRRRSIAEFEESILSGSALDIQTETTETDESTAATDTSFLSEFGVPGMGTMQADEVDPIAEAEVYMAYGRDEQAEEVLKEAIARDGSRAELKLKLLEIYQQRNDLKEFETLAEELYPAGGDDDNAVWNQVVDMGRKMNPDNPLFKGGAAAAGVAGVAAVAMADTDFESTSDGMSPFPTPELDDSDDQRLQEMADEAERTHPRLDPFVKDEERDSDASLAEDASLDLDSEDLDLGFDFADADEALSEDVDLDLGTDDDGGLGLGGVAAGVTAAAAGIGGDLLSDAKDDASEAGTSALDATLDGLSLDLDNDEGSIDNDLSFDLSLDGATESANDAVADLGADLGSSLNLDDSFDKELNGDFDLNLASVDDTPDLSVVEGGLEDDGETWSEAATKLDLAKAYIDMGDRSGAQSIIQEVLKEGNEGQRKEAQELAEQLTATG